MNIFLPAAVMDHFYEGIAVLDQDHRIQYVNSRFEKIFSQDRDRIIGLKLEHVVKFTDFWNWSEVYGIQAPTRKKTKYRTQLSDKEVGIGIIPIPNLDGSRSFLFSFNDNTLDDYLVREFGSSQQSLQPVNLEEIYYIASLPEMANTSNSSEEFMGRAHLKLVRTFRLTGIVTWVYTQTKELSLAGSSNDGSIPKEFAEDWFKKYKRHIDEALQADMPKIFNIDGMNFAAIPHKKRNSSFAVTLVACPESKRIQDSELKVLQIFGHQLGVSYENTKLQEGSTIDALTKLFNSKFFHGRISSELLIAETTQSPLSLLIIDVDHFKNFNDTYGHTTGDLVLAEVGKVLKGTCRASDVVCRYGGEEFGVILIDTEPAGAEIVAEKIRTAIQDHIFDSSRPEIHVTVSVGIATFPNQAANKEQLIENADAALYQAKKTGRNKSVLFQKGSK